MPSGGTQSDTLIKDVAQTIDSELFPGLTRLLEQYGQFGRMLTDQAGSVQRTHQEWAQPAFQVKQACDRIVEQIRRGDVDVDQIQEIQLPQVIREQPGGERYLG